MSQRLRLSDYSIVFFCPLVVEQQAVCLMLDELHDEIPERSSGQTILYTLGRIASENVAIAGYPDREVGLGVSGSMASEVLRDFPNFKLGLLVGIAAGIPSPTRDIRLGDVAVAVPNQDNPGVIGYDLVKVQEDQIQLKQWLNATDPLLRSAIANIQVHESRPDRDFTRHLETLKAHDAVDYERPYQPPPSGDFLASGPRLCEPRNKPKVHYGTILSGNGVIKSKKKRDELRDRFGGIALEMEAAGMMTRIQLAVVRGISDFADSQKNDDWHKYAAVSAAAYAKEIVVRLGSRKEAENESQSVIVADIDAALRLSLPEQRHFVGRQQELSRLETLSALQQGTLRKSSVVAVWGLSGSGKSQLVSEFVKRQREKDSRCDIFWISGESKETFEQSIIGLLKAGKASQSANVNNGDAHEEQRAALINSFFSELKSSSRANWILVVDGIPSSSTMHTYIRRHTDSLACGSVILITRGREIATRYQKRLEVKGLSDAEAAELLRLDIDPPLIGSSEEMTHLCRVLEYHPLALSLAASTISNHPMTVTQYIEKWTQRQLDDAAAAADRALLHSFEVSFDELETSNHMCAKLLMLFGYLDHRDLWLDLCEGVDDEDFPDWTWLLDIAKQPQQAFAMLRNLSFAEAKLDKRKGEFVYKIHPAIHEFARWKARERGYEEDNVRLAVSLVAAKVPRSSDEDFLTTAQRLEPHADQCRIYMEQDRGGIGIDLVEIEKFGNLYRHLGRHDEASKLYQAVLGVLRQEEEPDAMTEELIADIENNLGLVFHAQREYDLAIRAFDKSCQMRFDMMVENEIAADTTIYNKGRSLLMLGQLEESLDSLYLAADSFRPQQALEGAQREEFGQIYYRILNDIGEVHLRNGHTDAAEATFKEAFEGQKQYLHEQHPATFAVRLNIGRVCVEQSRFSTANRIFDYIIATYTGWWGRSHSETMRTVAEKADAVMRHGEMKSLMGDGGNEELSDAEKLWTEVLEYNRAAYGADSEAVALSSSKLQKIKMLESLTPSEDTYRIYYA